MTKRNYKAALDGIIVLLGTFRDRLEAELNHMDQAASGNAADIQYALEGSLREISERLRTSEQHQKESVTHLADRVHSLANYIVAVDNKHNETMEMLHLLVELLLSVASQIQLPPETDDAGD